MRSLAASGIDDPAREARLIARHAADAVAFAAMVARRAAREPMSHILGRREFWSLDFAVGPDCLDPRPDSETLVEAALAELADRSRAWRVLDLGTGSGCLLLALLAELPCATGIGLDRSAAALSVAAANAGRLGLAARSRFVRGDWGGGLSGPFDAILANPPYIPSAEIATLAPEIARFEPRLALDGGADGLDAYRALVPGLPRLLAPGGFAALEIGAGQKDEVARIAVAAGLALVAVRRDLAGHERCLIFRPAVNTI